MLKRLLLLTSLTVFYNNVFAQLVGGNVFLQGAYTEIGQDNMGAFGTCTSPGGYHPHYAGTALGEVYDYGHDGWTVGTPPYMGDYTEPGTPFEGWSVQIGGTEYRNWVSGAPCTGLFAMAGTNTAYSNSGGTISGTWTGGIGGLKIVSESRVDTFASAVVVTVRFYNTTAAPIAGVYYERTCDPDNVSTWGGSISTTHNRIVHQNEDDRHEVLVSAVADYPTTGTYAMFTYMGLGTKDCRAVCTYFGNLVNSYGLMPSYTPAQIWSKTVTPSAYSYVLADSDFMDIGYALSFNIGTISAAGTPGDSAVISFAYIWNTNNGIDSAFPDPQMVVNGVPIPNAPEPNATYDTFNVCSFPGLTHIPVSILHAIDKDWTWSTWTWSPSTALATTTGVIDSFDITALTGPTTYTITGTDSSTGMFSCNRRVFYLTILPCHTAYNNSPCVGDALVLGDRGDSLGASYFWHGPGGFTSFVQDPVISPATFADTGFYFVIKTIGTVHDTDSTYVIIHPLPTLNLASNIPLCGPTQDPLTLSATPDSLGETFSWTGPNGFTSTLEFPSVTGFDSSDQGFYTVIGITQYGCKNTASIGIFTGVVPNFTYSRNLGCQADTVYFNNISSNADSFAWSFGDGSAIDNNRNPAPHIYTRGSGVYNVTLSCYNAHCDSTVLQTIDLTHSVQALFSIVPDTFCLGYADTLINASTATVAAGPGSTYGHTWTSTIDANAWDFGDGTTDNNATPAPHVYTTPGVFNVRLAVTDDVSCVDILTKKVYVLKMSITSLNDTLLCLSDPLLLYNTITTIPPYDFKKLYTWTQSTPNLSDTSVQEPTIFKIGDFTDTLTVTLPNVPPDGCPIRDTVHVHSVQGQAVTNVTPTSVIQYGSSIQLNASGQVVYRWLPDDGSLNNNNINDPVATPLITTTYTVFGLDKNGCVDSAYVTVIVDSSMHTDLPSGFTPNGDGVNDVFRLVGLKYQKLVEFSVYNRWGQQVFHTNNPSVGWDGTYDGVPQDLGVYYYVIIAGRPGGYGDNVTYKGEITLIR